MAVTGTLSIFIIACIQTHLFSLPSYMIKHKLENFRNSLWVFDFVIADQLRRYCKKIVKVLFWNVDSVTPNLVSAQKESQ